MAIDTVDKRRSAYVGGGLWNLAPMPVGSVSAVARMHRRWLYRMESTASVGAMVVVRISLSVTTQMAMALHAHPMAAVSLSVAPQVLTDGEL